MSNLVASEGLAVASVLEATFNTQPTSGWRQEQPNPDGIQEFAPKIKKVRRNPLSVNAQNEKGDVVDLDAEPNIVQDLNWEWLYRWGVATFLSAEKISGCGASPSAGRFFPTAVTSSQFTVPTMTNALVTSTLVFARGFSNSANNGLFVVAAASSTTAIKVTGTVAEASPPSNAYVEVVGFQCASADVTSTATTLLSTALDFTTLQLNVGQWIWLGGGTAASPGALGFATAGTRGFARLTAIAAHTLTVDRTTQAWSVDAGTGKTIQIFFGSFLRHVAQNHADYIVQTASLEIAMPGAGAAGATDYLYANGMAADTVEFNAPGQDKIVVTLNFKGTGIADPTTSRATGPSTAPVPIATAALNTATELPRLRVALASDNTSYCVDIDNWKLTAKNNIYAQKQQGTLGVSRVIGGKRDVEVDINAFVVQDDMIKAIRSNVTLMWEACLRNNDCGAVLDIPAATVEDGALKTQANGPVMISGKLMAFRDPTMNYTLGLSKFPYLPAT